MKPIVLIPIAVLVSCAASYVLCSTALRPAPLAAQPAAASAEDVAALQRELGELRGTQRDLVSKLDQLGQSLAARPAEARVPMADIEAAVERALAARGKPADLAEARPSATPVRRSATQAVEALLALSGDWDAASKLWAELRKEGLLDEVLAQFEARAKARADDPDAQVELGSAYLQKLFSVPAGPEQGTWAMKADQAFDAALALDSGHWSARFSKAVSLSNWPAFLGKQGEAAQQFETLIEQQSRGPAQPQHAQSYFFLGNLYQGMGRMDQARATWQKGSEMFPDNAQLKKQLEVAGPR